LGSGSCCDSDALNANELQTLFRHPFHFKAQFDRLTNSLRDLVKGSRLRVASRKLGDRCNVVPSLVALYDDIELVWQWIVFRFHFTRFGLWGCWAGPAKVEDANIPLRVHLPERDFRPTLAFASARCALLAQVNSSVASTLKSQRIGTAAAGSKCVHCLEHLEEETADHVFRLVVL
jgi:hypothetical protein